MWRMSVFIRHICGEQKKNTLGHCWTNGTMWVAKMKICFPLKVSPNVEEHIFNSRDSLWLRQINKLSCYQTLSNETTSNSSLVLSPLSLTFCYTQREKEEKSNADFHFEIFSRVFFMISMCILVLSHLSCLWLFPQHSNFTISFYLYTPFKALGLKNKQQQRPAMA